jgi:hypothetical protein
MEFKGTKGKWNLLSNVSWCEIQTESPIKSICAINKNIEEYEANALLISKAPEMLEMLQSIVSSEMTLLAIRKEARQLIKEATEI